MKGKTKVPNLSHERLLDALDYNPATGAFVWRISPAKNVKAGTIAGGSNDKRGYSYVRIDGEEITTSRLAWFYVNGEWPERRVRFKNGDRNDASFENLTLFNGIGGEFDFKTQDGRNAYLRAYRKAVPHLEKARALRDSFGISLEEYHEMLAAQGGKCAICGNGNDGTRHGKLKALAVDHCHKTGKVRGLLCESCNQGIGKLKDDPSVLRKAADYIERHCASGQ
jgi:hypothetical protein